jgi:hypothetical protein
LALFLRACEIVCPHSPFASRVPFSWVAATLAPIPTNQSDTGGGSQAAVKTTDWIEFETILLTFLVDTQSLGGSTNKSKSSSSSSTSNDKGSSGNRRRRRWLRRRKQPPKKASSSSASAAEGMRRLEQTMDAEALLDLTTSHVTSSSRTTTTSTAKLASLSQAVNGKVKFNRRIEQQVDSPGVVQHMVDQAFEGDAMERFLDALKGSSDPVMQHIEIVYKGLPSDLQGTSDTSNAESESLASSFEWNNWWIFIVAGAGAGLLVCCLSSSCVFYRCWTSPSRNKKKKKGQQKKVDDNEGGCVDPTQSNDDTAPGDEAESPKTSKSSGSKSPVPDPADKKDGGAEEDVVAAAAGKFGGDADSLIDVSEMDNESYVGRYNPSDATSVYSYIDGHTMMLADGDDVDMEEDQSSYSIAPSLMYDRIMPDDQSIQSRMWSVADGITYDGNLSLIEGKAPSNEAVAPGRVLVFGGGNKSGKGGGGGAGQRASGAIVGAGLNVDDYDDDLSLMSELNAPEGNVKEGSSELRVLQVVKKQDSTAVEAASNDPTPSQVSKPPPASHSTPYTNMKSDDDDDDSSSESSYGPSATDASRSPNEAAALKKRLASQGVSVRVRKSKENLLNNRDVIAALGESSASDDDSSSLFMGPADLGKASSTLLPLSAKDMVDPLATSTNGSDRTKKRDEFRFGPLRLGSKKLTRKEKELLKRGANDADQQDDAGTRAFPIPRELMNQSEEKKDDMSVSSIGSTEATRAKALIDSVASF